MVEAPTRTLFERILFWTTYILGTLTLLFSFLLAQVPRPRHGADFTLDYVCWSLAAGFLVASLLTARLAWRIWNPFSQRVTTSPIPLAMIAAWIELAFSIYGIMSFATSS